MKAQVIPAQITTVEDRIAGSLSLTQILILLSPVFFASLVFAVFPPSMKLALYKPAVTLVFGLTAVSLAVRVRGKLVIQWLGVLARYSLRPKYYVFDKNDGFMRTPYLPEEKARAKTTATVVKKRKKVKIKSLADLIRLEELLKAKDSKVTFTPGRKGGVRVAFKQVV